MANAKYHIYDFLAGLNIPISQAYGADPTYYAQFGLKGHEGVDFPTLNGTPFYAPFDGIIVRDGINIQGWKNYGTFTVIWDPVQCIALWFCHLQDYTFQVGDTVKMGDLLGHTNNTGNTRGEHVHVNFCETDVNGARTNQNNGFLGFLDIMDTSLVEWLPMPGKPLSVASTPSSTPDLSQGLTVYKGIDMTNVASVKAAIDAWYDVSHDVYVKKADYDALQAEKNQSITDKQTVKDAYTTDLKNYTEMKAAGYSSLSDINTKIEVMDNDTTTLTQNLIAAKNRNKVLSDQVNSFEGQDITGLNQWLKSKEKVSNLEQIVTTFAKILKTKPDLTSMLTALDSKFREYDTRLKMMKEQQVTADIVNQVVKNEVQTIEKNPDMWTELFGIFSTKHIN